MRRAGYNPTQNEVLDIINRFTLRTSKQKKKKVSAKILRSSYNIWARAIKELSNEHLLYKLIYLWRLDVEKEVDSLDILGDLDFKVEHPLLAMFQVGKYVFGNVSNWQICFRQISVSVPGICCNHERGRRVLRESRGCIQTRDSRSEDCKQIVFELVFMRWTLELGSLTILRWTTGKRSGCLQKTRTAAFRSRRWGNASWQSGREHACTFAEIATLSLF